MSLKQASSGEIPYSTQMLWQICSILLCTIGLCSITCIIITPWTTIGALVYAVSGMVMLVKCSDKSWQAHLPATLRYLVFEA
jgi:hypothetical protein